MTLLEIRAYIDAEVDYDEGDASPAEWLTRCLRVIGGHEIGPAAHRLSEVGLGGLCRAWHVEPIDWATHSAAWFRAYDAAYCARIQVLVRETAGRIS